MGKWTIESVRKLIKVGDFSKNQCGQSAIVHKITDNGLIVLVYDGNDFFIGVEDLHDYSFYDYSTLKEILPPKQDERVAMYESVDTLGGKVICNKDGTLWNFNNENWVSSIYDYIRKANRKKEIYGYLNITKNVMEWE